MSGGETKTKWILDEIKHLLEFRQFSKGGKLLHVKVTTYDPARKTIGFNYDGLNPDNKLLVTPTQKEIFVYGGLEISQDEWIIKNISASINDQKIFSGFNIKWERQGNNPIWMQYVFADNKAIGYKNSMEKNLKPFPNDAAPVINEDLGNTITELSIIRPYATESIDACVKILTQPGINYKG